MKNLLILFAACIGCTALAQTPFRHDLASTALAHSWDEAMPLGNGIVGNLVWEKGGKLRFSLDRADLWDQRRMADVDKLNWQMIVDQVAKKDYAVIQQLGDVPYEREAAPSKIPGAALEFDITSLGPISSSRLYIREGIAEVKWKNGTRLLTFIHPSLPLGWFRWEKTNIKPVIVPPAYTGTNKGTGNSVEGQGLARLGYPQGEVSKGNHTTTYRQPGWDGFVYEVTVTWQEKGDVLEGVWSVTANTDYNLLHRSSSDEVKAAWKRGYTQDQKETVSWWAGFWNESSLSIPDSIIERQWYLDNYKFGCIARNNMPPITLQAIWTADNGNLPPWKGDIHNDLNTQLSYWPAYSGNHLLAAHGFTNWLWSRKPVFEKYTRRFFHKEGLAVPGVTTLDGQDMGGWVQYSYSPTTAGWLSQHFYWDWRYSMDKTYLKDRAYPWISGVATFFENMSVAGTNGKRKLPLSSSPEFFDNSLKAWFTEPTNYDLSIIRYNFAKAAELAEVLGLTNEAKHWTEQLSQWPELSLDDRQSLALAPGIAYPESHRHFSHLLGFHPLGLLQYDQPTDRPVLEASMKLLEEKGSALWTGYSFSWQANMYARMRNGEKAAETLRIFSTCFCLPNSFHVNGDQCTGKYSSMRYRPFTLEGNFAAASATQEMLLQSYDGIIRLFPAIPDSWKKASFEKLRAEGSFVISAQRVGGKTTEVTIISEKGGDLVIENSLDKLRIVGSEGTISTTLKLFTYPGQIIRLRAETGKP